MTGVFDDENSFSGKYNLWSQEQISACKTLLDTMQTCNLEVIRVSFVDQHGVLRGKTIVASGLASALNKGITMSSTMLLKDTSHRTVFSVWQDDAGFGEGQMTGASDVLMLPDPTTFKILPWSPHTGWILADLYQTDGTPVELSTRAMLKKAQQQLNDQGYEFIAGLEVEFHVFRTINKPRGLDDAGQPGPPPTTELLNQGYQYLTEDRYDEMEEVFDLIRRNAQGLDLPVRSLEVEFGPSQFEVTFDPAPALQQADNMILFRSMVKQVCQRNGLHATFMCRPRFEDSMASGWHLHQSIVSLEHGNNCFEPAAGEPISRLGQHWIAGILAHAKASCVLSTPTINGYKRYRPFTLAPDRIQWGKDNRGAMVRCLANPGDNASRIENRVGEPAANPYLYLASQIISGMDGVNRELEPPAPVSKPYDTGAETLPQCLMDAVQLFESSALYRQQFGDTFVDYYAHLKKAEWNRYLTTVSEWEEREYFNLF
ncbi:MULTISPECIES: glutamine synthetase family protein [unclassified Oceanobacter]|uniref:glutamine synthetase family protein n=2 Tax=Gammaproteobacteria TaxID=1236 RepID=UPI0026E18021|nr:MULTISPECIES: glutamine synthetase family protein [unclassified Oceanobacter]MDO6680730.1 glutamine synthetase family protein [Oceanobacter sp. 5_MG-2023]MDP2504498.1 glutamine synthetase family protein [Oceanobacter sp. 3_MG-2023]